MSDFKQGKQIESLDELMKTEFIFLATEGRVVHCGWFRAWQLNYAQNKIKSGKVFIAEKKAGGNTHVLPTEPPEQI